MRILIVIGLLLVVLTGIGLIGLNWYQQNIQAPSTANSPQTITVNENATTQSVLVELETKGLIKSTTAAKIYLRLNTSPTVKPGTYSIPAGSSLPKILEIISSSPKDIRVTFPEGWRREQYAARLENAYAQIPGARFSKSEFLTLTQNKEGHLFPDTYNLPATATPQQVIDILELNFKKKTGLDPFTDQRIIIVASMVERETRNDVERPIVAGIINNRLQAGWLLNIDATVQYAIDTSSKPSEYWKPLTNTQFPSLFNTYLHTGLPPAPICNPGLSSIEAAKAPAETDYMYYLHDSTGAIHFAKTLDEHNRNVDRYLKI